MSRRKRIYLLMALIPSALGVATFALLSGEQPEFKGEQSAVSAPAAAPEAAPLVREGKSAPALIAPIGAGGGTPAAAPRPQAPGASEQPAANPQPVEIESDEAVGPARYAGAGPTEANDSSQSYASHGRFRLASFGGIGGGGGSRGSSDEPQNENPESPQETPNPGNEGSPGAGPSDPPGGGEHTPGNTTPSEPTDNGKPSDPKPGDEGGGDDDDGNVPTYPPDPEGEKEPVRVPEPGTMGLLALGLLGCAARRKSRK